MLPELFPQREIVARCMGPRWFGRVDLAALTWLADSVTEWTDAGNDPMDSAAWATLMAVLTVVSALFTVRAFRRRGVAAGMRGVAITLLPPAAWLTGTLEMFTEIAGSVADWATGLVFNPFVWIGTALFGTSAALFLISSRLRGRELPGGPGRTTPAVAGTKAKTPVPVDDDLAEIEDLLRKHGIS